MKRISLFVLFPFFLLAVGGEAQEPPRQVMSQAARMMRFSGVLKNRDNTPRTGTQGLTFALHKEQQGGSPLWMETLNAEVDEQGRYAVLLGSTQPEGLPLELFSANEARWLGVQGQLPGDEEQRLL